MTGPRLPPFTSLEDALKSALERHLEGSDGKTPSNLADAIRYSLLAPGKRIRPRLCLATAQLVGLSKAAALPAALALEMIHCFTLIHDDLPCMDDDDFRRGRPSNHKVHGEAVALLAGDALMMLALEVFMDSAPHVPAPDFLRALRRLAWASGPRGVMGGQAAESLLNPQSKIEELETMHAMKTGALFSASLLLPKDLAGIPDKSPPGTAPRGETLARFAAELGLAFQVADDLDDAQTQGEAGKPTSVLFYQTAEKTRSETLARLNGATQALAAVWGAEPSAELAAISDEVIRSLSK
jgi:geranylgeranyl diphosphate synthase type II